MTIPPIITIASHRGGTWKSSLASVLALEMARRGITIALVDPAFAGGLAGTESPQLRPTMKGDMKARTHVAHPLHLIHLPHLLRDGSIGETLHKATASVGPEVILVDLPTASREELGNLLRSTLILTMVVPVDLLAFRSLPPFMEFLKEQRAMPGRRFDVRACLTGTGNPNPRFASLESTMRENLGPILMPGSLPQDEALASYARDAFFPDDLPKDSPAHREIGALTSGMMKLLNQSLQVMA